ncbi:Thiol-disulfide oxidoreductase ResA [Candidatus Calditenuaceae archaeon HR02]|nr:Thiol-disulfide oxidoreductase ResA [Candidatus Calditenuaceae archaeon HR02]
MLRRPKIRKRSLAVTLSVITLVTVAAMLLYFAAPWKSGVSSGGYEGLRRPWYNGGKLSPYVGDLAPDFEAMTIDGLSVRLSELRGRPVIVWFMAAWCPSCTVVGEAIRDVASGKAEVVVIDVWTPKFISKLGLMGGDLVPPPEGEVELRTFVQRLGARDWLLILDSDSSLSGQYALTRVDTLFVISREGIIVLRSDGPTTRSILEAALKEAEARQSTQNCPICPGY